jgi:hypothetical protein
MKDILGVKSSKSNLSLVLFIRGDKDSSISQEIL